MGCERNLFVLPRETGEYDNETKKPKRMAMQDVYGDQLCASP